jgi:putative transposase
VQTTPLQSEPHVPSAKCFAQWLLRLEEPIAQCARTGQRGLLTQIEQVHERSRQCHGAYKTWRALIAQGIPCGRHRVARLRHRAGIEAKRKRRFRITTQAREGVQPAPNVLEQSFSTQAANRVWATDITFVPTAQGWLYLAVIVDLYSRRVVGPSRKRTDPPESARA